MEFNLRIQEFIELVRQDKRLDAVRLVLILIISLNVYNFNYKFSFKFFNKTNK